MAGAPSDKAYSIEDDISDLKTKVDKLEEKFKKLNMRVVGLTRQVKNLKVTQGVDPQTVFSLAVDLAAGNYTRLMKETLPPLLEKYGLTMDRFGVRKIPTLDIEHTLTEEETVHVEEENIDKTLVEE